MEWRIKFQDMIVHADSEEEARKEAVEQEMVIDYVEQY